MTHEALKIKIVTYLSKINDATAVQITKAVGEKNYPSRVVSAINELRTDGVINGKTKKGHGQALWYWLVDEGKPEAEASIPDADAGLLALANRELSSRVETLLKAIGHEDNSGDGILTAVAMADMNRQKAARVNELEEQLKAAQHATKNAEAANSMLHESLKRAESQRDGWRRMAGMFYKETPVELGAFISSLQNRITELEAKAARSVPEERRPLPCGRLDQPVWRQRPQRRKDKTMSKENGGPAFPRLHKWQANHFGATCNTGYEAAEYNWGMSLRDYFAAKAMQGFAADPEASWKDGITGMARCAYGWADAMLAARKAEVSPNAELKGGL